MENELSLLSNEEIVFIYERLIKDLVLFEVCEESYEHKVKERKEKAGDIKDPLAKRFSSFIAKESEKRKKDFLVDISKSTKMIMLRQIISTLDLPYYAITGRSKDVLIQDIKKSVDLCKAEEIVIDVFGK